MKRTTSFAIACLLMLIPLVGVAFAFTAEWPEEASFEETSFWEGWDAPAYHTQIELCEIEQTELDQKLRITQDRVLRKQQLSLEVAEGRLSLRDAAQEFRSLNHDNETFFRTMRLCHPNCNEDELHIWNVIHITLSNFELHSPKFCQTRERLLRELNQMKLNGGGQAHLD